MSQLQNCKFELIVKPGRERSLRRRHPWVFSGAVQTVRGDPGPGDTLRVLSAEGAFLAWAAYSPKSQIAARVWSWNPDEVINEAFFYRKISQAIAVRLNSKIIPRSGISSPPAGEAQRFIDESSSRTVPENSTAARLVYAESDGLPGLIVDRYAGVLVMQLLAAGAERWRETLVEACQALIGAEYIYERSDVDVRRLEGLPERSGPLRGGEPPERVLVSEPGPTDQAIRYAVDVRHGHKTAAYLDQRVNRAIVGRLARNREVLDCFTYTGGFSLHAAAGGAASILAVDASAAVLAQARQNADLNEFPPNKVNWQEGDVFQTLRAFRDARRSFDLIVLDPPKFAQTAAQAERAARGYKDINLLALKLLRPAGLLATFSCSGGISEELFQKIVAGAALDAGVEAQILERLHQAPDHPVALNFPEGAYLKGFVIRRGEGQER